MHYGFDLRYYLSLLRRRFLYILIPFAVVAGVSTAIVLVLPPIYRSTGKILVESQQIPVDLVRSTVTSYADERIQIIKQQVMTRENLLRIVEKFNLFSDRKQRMSSTEVVDAMQKAIVVAPLSTNLQGLRRRAGGTIAFTVSFEHEQANTAMRVANELVTLFLDENVRSRTFRATETTEFLEQEASKLKKQVDAIEAEVAKYKQQYSQSLPEHLSLRISMLERAQSSLKETNREIKSIAAEKRFLDIQLDAIKAGFSAAAGLKDGATGTPTPEAELKRLQLELVGKSAVYKATHPDLIVLKNKVEALEKRVTTRMERKDLQVRLNELETQREELRARFAKGHPKIKSLTKEIAGVRQNLETLPAGTASASARGADIDPARANVLAKIEVANGRQISLSNQRDALKKRIADLEAMIVQIPQVERGLRSLSRDYENALKKYEEVKSKAMEAQLGKSLEEDKKAERFVLLEPPVHPDKPVKPNRQKLLMLGLALAFAAGAGGIMLIESVDGSIRGTAGFIGMLKQRPLIAIPYIVTPGEIRRRRWAIIAMILGALALIACALVVLHFHYKPLDVLWFKILDRLQLQ
ncbi:MAG: Wzz/FepE/Etk N-terminal domain-containing protein [Alphaproteobacteria bacterium]|nr:Wzz/FepE/Etk N-terminal domain-containing protein [Alphaproteobacteria bacterium]